MDEAPIDVEEGALLGRLVAPFLGPFLKGALIAACLYAALNILGVW